MNNPLLEAALSYAGRGWSVFPCDPPTLGDDKSGKRPIGGLVPNGKDDATTDAATIVAWWSHVPNANVGIALDKSGLVALDIDIGTPDKPKLGRESLAKIDAELVPTPTAITGSGGLHALYSAGASPIHAIDLLPGLDVIGNGYIIAAPSRHWTGGEYRWNDTSRPIAPVPEILRRLIGNKKLEKISLRQDEVGAPLGEGGRNAALFRLGASLRDTGIGASALASALHHENQQRCKPPLGDVELRLIVDSILKRVQPTRDVAAAAAVSQDLMIELFPAPTRGLRARDVVSDILAKADLPTVSTPWERFNVMSGGGLEIGSITLAVGYQGSGKSSMSAQLAAHHAKTSPVVYYLGEMGARMFVARIVGQALGKSWQSVLHGEVSASDMHTVLDPLNLIIVPAQTSARGALDAIKFELDALEPTAGVPLLVIDYIQLLATPGPDMRQATIAAVREIQAITEERKLATWVLSQASRGASKRIREGAEDSIDLADVGAETAELERAATIQFAIAYQQKDDTRIHEITLAIGKRRFGGPTKLYFDYDGETGIFTDRLTAIKSQSEIDREANILAEFASHENGRCAGRPGTACTGDLSGNTLRTGIKFMDGKVHRLGGKKELVDSTLRRLVAEKRLIRDGQSYRLPKHSE